MKTVIITVVILALIGLWTSGRMDYALVNVGLNFNDCAKNGFGATFCGPDLKDYQSRIDSITTP